MEVSRKQIQQVLEALLSAFDYAQLEQLLYFELERDLEDIASSQTEFPRVCFKLIRRAERDGWLEDLVRAAIENKPRNDKLMALAQDLQLDSEKTNSTTTSGIRGSTGPNADDPLLIIEDFKKDLEEIPADQPWNSEDYEHELESLQSRLPNLRAGTRSLLPQQGTDLAQSVLRELRFEDIGQEALGAINAFEIGLSGLLNSARPRGSPIHTRYVQFYRRKNRDLSENLSRLQHLGMNPPRPHQTDTSSAAVDLSLSTFIQRLRDSHVSDAIRLDERKQILNMYSGIDASINAVVDYLNSPGVPAENNVRKIRKLLVSAGAFIAYTALAQKRLPAMPGSVSLFSPGEGTRLQKICNEALDGLDRYNRIIRELISSGEEAALSGAARSDAQDLYPARRSLIDSLVNLRRRIAELTY
jgi:hypothetical protein